MEDGNEDIEPIVDIFDSCNGESVRDLRVLQWCCDACAVPCLISRVMSKQDLAFTPRHSVDLKSAPGSPLGTTQARVHSVQT